MDVAKQLRRRFTQAIRKSFRPCPLIGPRWFRFSPDGKPARFEFVGVRRLAKATARKPQTVVRLILKNLDLGDIKADVTTTTESDISVALRDTPKSGENG